MASVAEDTQTQLVQFLNRNQMTASKVKFSGNSEFESCALKSVNTDHFCLLDTGHSHKLQGKYFLKPTGLFSMYSV